MDDLTDLIERLNEARAHCGMCGEQAVVRNSRGQYICEACLHETIPTPHYRMRWEAADAIEALQARVSELEAKAKSDAMDYLADTGQLMDRLETARRDAFEEAAKVAEHIMSDYAELTYSPHHDRMQNAAKTYCAGEIAAAIRALAEKG